jgi:ABC-type amino acid transport substrate-binding protein
MHDTDTGKKLMLRRVDLFPYGQYSIAAFARTSGISIAQLEPVWLLSREGGYYLALGRHSSPALVAKLSAAVKAMRDDGSLDTLTRHWQPARAPKMGDTP